MNSDIQQALEHHKELVREAEREYNIHQALAGLEQHPTAYDGVVMWLGDALVEWGQRLQVRKTRYGSSGDSPSIKIIRLPQSIIVGPFYGAKLTSLPDCLPTENQLSA